MKRQRHNNKSGGVYFIEDEEDFLVYETGDLLAYQSKMNTALLPEHNESLLRHLCHLMAFLDDIYELFYQKEWLQTAMHNEETTKRPNFNILFEAYDEEKENEESRIGDVLRSLSLGAINETVFQWHIDIMQRGEPMTGLYATCYFMSWSAFARTFHLTVYSNEEKRYHYTSKSAPLDAFCSLVSKRENVIVTAKEIIKYSVTDLWDSARIILPSLYAYNFCRPMKDYIFALFFRYCDLLAIQQHREEGEEDEIFDNPLFFNEGEGENEETEDIEEMYDAYKRIAIESGANYSIQTEFLFEGEVLFYYQLHRLHLSCRLQTLYERRAFIVPRTIDLLQTALRTWYECMLALAKHEFLRTHVIEAFRRDIYEIQLYHGERECYRRKFPESMCEARDVLDDCRVSVLRTVTETERMTLQDMLKHFVTATNENIKNFEQHQQPYEECVLCEGTDAWPMLSNERECLLLTKVATLLWFKSEKVTCMKRLEQSFLLEELHSLDSLETLVFEQFTTPQQQQDRPNMPVFVKLMRLYYVIVVINDKCQLYKSLFFFEAYFVWLAMCVRLGFILPVQLHPSTTPLVSHFNKVIQF